MQALECDGRSGGVACELEDAGSIIGFEPDGVMDVEARVGPVEHGVDGVVGEELAACEGAEQGAAKGLGQDVVLMEAEVQEGAVGPEEAVGDQEVEMRMPVSERAKGLDGTDDAGDAIGLAQRRAQEVAQRAVRDTAQESEEPAVVEEEGPQSLGDGEDELAVWDGVEEFVLEPVGPDLEALGVTAGAEVARLAAEGNEELGLAALADDAGETVLEDAAVEEALQSSPGDVAQAPVLGLEAFFVDADEGVEEIFEQPVQRRLARSPRPVDGALDDGHGRMASSELGPRPRRALGLPLGCWRTKAASTG